MWCPSVSLAVWANAWLAGQAAPDDVLDALSCWAPAHSVNAYDAAAAGRTGLPWPDVDDAGGIALLQAVRTAAGPPTGVPALNLVLPVAGDVRGLPVNTVFTRDALTAGEALIITPGTAELGSPIGLVPEFRYDEFELDGGDAANPTLLTWAAYSLPSTLPHDPPDLGAAEYELREAVRTATSALAATVNDTIVSQIENPREMVAQLVAAARQHPAPENTPVRAQRVLDLADQVDAINTVTWGALPSLTTSSAATQVADDALRPLDRVVRSARLAAVTAILQAAWSG